MHKSKILLLGLIMCLGLLLGATGFGSTSRASDQATEVLPPAPVTGLNAVFTGQAVELTWMPSQAGTFPVASYVVSTSADNLTYTDLETIGQTTYTDPGGHIDQYYRVRALDDQAPPNASIDSDLAQAKAPAEPAPTEAESVSAVTETSLNQSAKSENQHILNDPDLVAAVDQVTDQKLTLLSQQLDQDESKIILTLDQFINAKATLIDRFTQQSPAAVARSIDTCLKQETSLETTVLVLPENLQAKAYEALAQCSLIIGSHD